MKKILVLLLITSSIIFASTKNENIKKKETHNPAYYANLKLGFGKPGVKLINPPTINNSK